MTVPTPPRPTGNAHDDALLLIKYAGDLYRSLVSEAQLPQRADRTAAIDATVIANPVAQGTKVIDLTPFVLPEFTDPPTPSEMGVLRAQVNALSAVVLLILKAAQKQ